MNKPFLRWPGGKTRVLSVLRPLLPKDFKNYFEPFVGGGAMFLNLQPEYAYIGDVNQDLVNCYKVIKSKPEALLQDLKTHEFNHQYFHEMRSIDRYPEYAHLDDVQRASRFIYLNKSCFNGHMRYNRHGFINSSYGYLKKPAIPDVTVIMAAHNALQRVRIANGPFEELRGLIKKDDFVYMDPPYDQEFEGSMDCYTSGGFGVQGQCAVFSTCVWLDKIGAKFMLSNAMTPRVLRLYREFNIHEIDAVRTFSRDNQRRGRFREVVVTNY